MENQIRRKLHSPGIQQMRDYQTSLCLFGVLWCSSLLQGQSPEEGNLEERRNDHGTESSLAVPTDREWLATPYHPSCHRRQQQSWTSYKRKTMDIFSPLSVASSKKELWAFPSFKPFNDSPLPSKLSGNSFFISGSQPHCPLTITREPQFLNCKMGIILILLRDLMKHSGILKCGPSFF